MADRNRMIQIVKRLLRADGTETELDKLMEQLIEISPDPEIQRFFFESKFKLYDADQIVDEALKYKPITL